jgi:kynureninase
MNKEAESIAIILFSGVQYYTGQLFDIPRVTKAARNQVRKRLLKLVLIKF